MSGLDHDSRSSRLRVAYVWRDEVMADVVARKPRKITLGTRGRATFVVPDLGLPNRFPVLKPGSRGYLLTLGKEMTGRLCLGGEETDVAEFLRRGGGERASAKQDSFRATNVAPGDWGVVHLDGVGDHSLFFQYVKADPPVPPARWRDSELLLPAICFAVILHAVIVIAALKTFWPIRHTWEFPGKREIMADYLLSRPPPPPPPQSPPPGEKAAAIAKPAATVGKEGKTGGKGEKPRARAPDPDKGSPDEIPAAVQVGLLSTKSREQLKKVRERGGFDEKLGRAMARIQGPTNQGSMGGHGAGEGTGIGRGRGTGTSTRGGGGTGGGGRNLGDVQSSGSLDTGGTRAGRGGGGRGVKEVAVKVDTGEPSGDLGGLTAAEILKVVMSRKAAIGTCFERELQRSKGLGGKVVLTWKINTSGAVEAARVKSTTLRNGRVEDCVVRQIQGLRFPQPRGGQAAVVRNFPFLFGAR